MDFKDILTQLDSLKGDEKKPVVEKKTKRPSNMLTESAEVVEPVTNELNLPSLKNVFEELSLEPAKPGAQEIHKDGQAIGSVSNPQVAQQMQQAMAKGELTIGEEEIQEAEDWIDKAVKKPGAFKAQAERAGMSTSAFAKHVLANKDKFNAKTEKRANLAKTFSKMKETDTPPESSMDLTSPISGGNMRESDGSGSYGGQSPLSYDTQRSSKIKEAIKLPEVTPKMGDNGSNTQSVISGKVKEGAQYPADDGSPNSTNDEKGNAAANAALAANDSDTPQLVKEKAKGKVSKSSKLPSISKVKSMCSEGLSTSQIKQLHPKCNQQELNIMIKNTKTNLKEGAEHILKAAKHMGKSHGLCKGSYACPHDAGSEGARAYHEGYKTGLDEACGMKNTYEDATDGFSADAEGMGIRNKPIAGMEEGEVGTLGGAALGAKMGGIPGAVVGGVAGNILTPANEENESETVDTMASYGAMGEAESSPDGNVGADDDGAYDKYDWDAQTVARKGIDEDEFEEGNAFSGAMVGKDKGDKFEVGGKTYTKTSETAELEEDAWTFESLEKELNSHLVEGKESTKEKLDEGYTMSITQGEQNQPDRVSVNATDAEADKLIKFVKDVGLGQYGDAEVVDIEQPEVGDVSFYGSPEVEVAPNGSHDDMLKLMGIVDMGNDDYEDEVEAPGVTDVDVQVDDESCDECGGGHSMEEGCGDSMKEESDAEMDDHAERAGKEVAHDAHYDGRKHSGRDGEDVTKDLEYDDYKDKHHMEEDQGYNDREDEQLGMKDGKESGKDDNYAGRRDQSRGDFGHRHGGHLEEESDAEMDDHAERAGKKVAHDAHYDGRKHSGRDGEDVTKDLEYDDYKDHHRADEGQGYDDKEDESLGMKDGKESDKKQSKKDRRDERFGKYGERDEEHREKSLEETLSQLDELAQLDEKQGYDDREDEQLGMQDGKESDKKQSFKDRRDDKRGKFGQRDKEDHDKPKSLEENLRTLDLLAEVGAESSEEPTQPLSQHDDERLLTKEGAEDAPKDSVNDGENEEITEVQTDDQREFTVAEKEDKEEKLDEWANDAGKNGTDTSFEQDIDFMTKVISGGLNKQKSTGQTTIPVIAGQEDRMGYNGADVVKEGSVMSSDGFATILNKLDSIK